MIICSLGWNFEGGEGIREMYTRILSGGKYDYYWVLGIWVYGSHDVC